jgi:hypothetical protein
MDAAGSGFLSREEFVQWYAKSEQRIQAQTRAVFDTVRDRARRPGTVRGSARLVRKLSAGQ